MRNKPLPGMVKHSPLKTGEQAPTAGPTDGQVQGYTYGGGYTGKRKRKDYFRGKGKDQLTVKQAINKIIR